MDGVKIDGIGGAMKDRMYVCMYVCMYASIVSKRLLQHGGRALVPPPAAF